MEDFSRAFLSKFSWELAQNKESLWTSVFKKKYIQGHSFLSAPNPARALDFCMGSFQCWDLILKELATRLGMSFFFIDVWNDPWIPNNPSFKPKAREGVQVTQQKLVVNLNIQEQEVETWTNYDNYFPKILSLMP